MLHLKKVKTLGHKIGRQCIHTRSPFFHEDDMFLGECKVERWEDMPKDGNEEDQGQACPEYRGLAGGGVGKGRGIKREVLLTWKKR